MANYTGVALGIPHLDDHSALKVVLRLKLLNILSRASEVGSPTNPPCAQGSDNT